MWYLITLWLHGWCSFEWMKLKSGEGDKKDEKDRDDGTTTTKTTYTNFGEHTRAQRRFRFGSLHGTYSHLYSSIRKWYAITSHSYPHSLSSCVCMYIRVFYFIWYILSIRRLMLIQVNHHSRKREHNMANSSNVCNKWGVTWHGNEYFPRGGTMCNRLRNEILLLPGGKCIRMTWDVCLLFPLSSNQRFVWNFYSLIVRSFPKNLLEIWMSFESCNLHCRLAAGWLFETFWDGFEPGINEKL